MSASLVLPLIVAIGLAIVVTTSHRRLPPVMAARAVTISLAVITLAAVPTLWIVAFGFVAHLSLLGGRLDWCAEAVGLGSPVPAWIGMPALILAVVGVVRVRAVMRSYRHLRHDRPGGVEIAEHEQPFAFTLPGRGGHVVLSSGLIEMLSEEEQAVVLAHERAHASHRHDRYIITAQLAAALMPPLRPMAGRLRFSLERWADEIAVAHCGDRELVARTLGKVALRSVTPAGAISFAGLGVPARVAALLRPPTVPLRSSAQVALWSAIVMTGMLAAFQLHHLARLITALCPG